MDPSVIREFLVSLGYEVDETGRRKFEQGVENSTKIVAGLAAGLAALIAAAAASAAQMEKLFFASQRTGAGVQGIQALGYAVADLGGTAEGALNSIESIARFMRNNPGGENYIKSLGVQTRDANGDLRDTSDMLVDIGKRLAQMPMYRANAYAQVLGIDEKTLLALRQGVGEFSDDYKRMADSVGLNSDRAAKQSHAFMVQLRGLWAGADILQKRFTVAFADKLTPVIEKARRWIEDNGAKIARVIDVIVGGLGVLANLAGAIFGRAVEMVDNLTDSYRNLDPETKKFVDRLAEIAAGVLLISRLLSMSPIGIVLTLGAAILALYDDFKVWKQGGDSLIDWGKWKPEIDLATAGMKLLGDGIGNAVTSFKWLGTEIENAYNWLVKFIKTVGDNPIVKRVLDATSGARNAVAGVMSSAADWVKGKISPESQKDAGDLGAAFGQIVDQITGKPYEKGVPDATAKPSASTDEEKARFNELQDKYGLPAGVLDNIFQTESSGGKHLTSPKGAQGPFQFMPATAKSLGLQGDDVNDFQKSSEAAARYLSQLLGMFNGDLRKAVAAYDWGPGNVQKFGLDAAPKETRDYILKVLPGATHIQQMPVMSSVIDPRFSDGLISAMRQLVPANVGGGSPAANLLSDDRLKTMMRGVNRPAENDANPYAADMYRQSNGRAVAPSSIKQDITYNINGARDPNAVGRDVQGRQDSVNQRLVRNLTPAAS